jgi:hypothetical protein
VHRMIMDELAVGLLGAGTEVTGPAGGAELLHEAGPCTRA